MEMGRSEQVRKVAEREYVRPASMKNQEIRIRVGDLEKTLVREGFPVRHINQICSALESEKFWGARLELHGSKGKPRRVDTIYEFSFKEGVGESKTATSIERDPLLELMGVLKGAIREGADAFVREIRRDKVSHS